MTAPVAVAVPQWRISTDRGSAARAARAAGADALHLDFGGGRRGWCLDVPAARAEARAIAHDLPVPVLAVNHLNDLGIPGSGGPGGAARRLAESAVECAAALGAGVLHVPGFRRSTITGPADFAATVEFLSAVAELARAHGLVLGYESALDAAASAALLDAVDAPALRVVLDTGNLRAAGHDPVAFATAPQLAGRILPDLHVKDPGPGVAAEVSALLAAGCRPRSVLVENAYGVDDRPAALSADVDATRRALGAEVPS